MCSQCEVTNSASHGVRQTHIGPRRTELSPICAYPCRGQKTARSLPMGSKPYRKERSKTILVVEDDDMIRFILRIVLGRMGYVVLEARDGADGLTVSRNFRGRIDLVVSDVRMPKMDGPEMV